MATVRCGPPLPTGNTPTSAPKIPETRPTIPAAAARRPVRARPNAAMNTPKPSPPTISPALNSAADEETPNSPSSETQKLSGENASPEGPE